MSRCALRLLPMMFLASPSISFGGESVPPIRSLFVYPDEVDLVRQDAVQRLVVWGELEDGKFYDLTDHDALRIESSDPAVVKIGRSDEGARPAVRVGPTLHAKGGAAQVRVRLGDHIAETAVRVQSPKGVERPRFVHDVLARLTHAGCNSGSCHGAQHGAGGFKLSLLGYEPDIDFIEIARGAGGRRVDPVDPDRSLLIAKPRGLIAHEGGVRFRENSPTHKALRGWIESRAPRDAKDAPHVESLSVFPRERRLSLEQSMHFIVTARLSDGSREDVTGRALLESLNTGVASVSPSARVVATGRGETSIMVRYQGQADVVRVTVPFRDFVDLASFEPRSFIDEHVARKWSKLGLEPSATCSNGEFIRRLFVASIGTLPTPEETRSFLDDPSPDKRDRLIDAVLERPEYVDYWTLKWGDLLRVNRTNMNEKGMWAMHNWLRAEVRANRPLDQVVSRLVTAQGSTYTSGPTNFFRVAQKPKDLAETTAQVFLGVRMQCAQCHHHPFEKWTQEDYWGLAAYFSRLGIKSSSEFGVYGREQVVYVKPSGEVRHPKTRKVVPPRPLGAGDTESKPGAADASGDRRRALASWLTSKDNRLFSRNLANRFWGYVFGIGIVEPIDDLRVTNPPTNPELLDALADALVEGRFDQKALLRTIFRSRVFQLSSRTETQTRGADFFFATYPTRRLSAEVLHDAICSATQVPEPFSGLPAGSRAIGLPDSNYSSYFLQSFGKPKRVMACECERVSRPNMAQALHLINGDFIERRVSHAKGRVAKLLAAKVSDEKIIDELYLATYSRRPIEAEVARVRGLVAASPSRKEAFEDVLWALCNSAEFLFNH